MGGGGSKPPSLPKRTVVRPNTNKTHNIQQGLQIKTSEGCSDCKLTIDPGVSASSVKITINPRPDKDGAIPISAADKNKTVPNIYQPSNSVTLTPSAPFTGSFNPTASMPYGVSAVWWDSMDLFWGAPLRAEGKKGTGVQGDACLLVRSSMAPVILMIPIQKTTDGSKKGVKFFSRVASSILTISGYEPPKSSYDPAQDPHVASDWEKLGNGDKSVDKDKVNAYIKYASDGHYDTGATRVAGPDYPSASADTGSDWSLHSLVTGNEGYYTWINTVYSLSNDGESNESVGGVTFDTTFMKWAPATQAKAQTMGNLTPRVVYFQEPVYMLESDFASLRGAVDARPPNEVVQTLSSYDPKDPDSVKDPNHVYYHPACCGAEGSAKNTTKSVQATFNKLQAQSSLDFWTSPTMQWIISAFILILMFLFLSWFLTYIHEDPNNIFAMVGHTIRPRPV